MNSSSSKKENDFIAILPKNIVYMILEHAFLLDLLPKQSKVETPTIISPKCSNYVSEESLQKDIQDKTELFEKVKKLSELKRINKRWRELICSEQFWEKIFVYYKGNCDYINIAFPESYNFKSFCLYHCDWLQELENKLQSYRMRYMDCDIYVAPRIEEKKGCDLF